jgi:hypothetical protein
LRHSAADNLWRQTGNLMLAQQLLRHESVATTQTYRDPTRDDLTDAPNLSLSAVDLSDGSYSTTKIYPVSGTPGNTNQNKAIGDFYVQFDGDLCAYHIPGGSFAMRFIPAGTNVRFVSDGVGGQFLEGTFELDVIEGTGVYRSVVGGHNHMVDRLHFLAPGDGSGGIDEYCFCFVSGP